MEILNLGNNSEDSVEPVTPKSKKLKVAKAAVGIGALASLTGLGSTLAANISLNNDANVEFGQGVAQTAACDEDGFTITPVSYYDADASTFRLDYVEVSGLNLTPMGSNYTSDSSVSYASQAAAITAHPGQYYDTTDNAWTNTCDQVVLDFKAYTDDLAYQTNTVDGYAALDSNEPLPNTVSSPLAWQVAGYGEGSFGGVVGENYNYYPEPSNQDFAFIYDSTHGESNYGTNGAAYNNYWGKFDWDSSSSLDNSSASFQFFARHGHHANELYSNNPDSSYWQDPAAGPIAKITVESMKYFPSGYENQREYYDNQAFESTWGDFGYYYLGSQYVPD